MRKDDIIRLQHMLDAACEAIEFTKGRLVIDRLVHAYFDINLDILWKTTQDDLPSLIAKLEQIKPEEVR